MSGLRPSPVVILISGRGSNMRALIKDSLAPGAPYRIARVIADVPAAPGLAAAAELGIATTVLPAAGFAGRDDYDRALDGLIAADAPALIALAGFMRILSARFIERYAGRILNIHPSLLPKHPGLDTHRRALAAGDTVHGATVHFVNAALDAGPAVLAARVPVQADDDERTLAARVLAAEHRIYPRTVRWFAQGRLICRDGRAWLDGAPLDGPLIDTPPAAA